MRSLTKQVFVLFFLFLGLGWQCGGGDGKDGNGHDSFIFPENSDQFSDQSPNDQTATDNGVAVDLAEATSETENGDEVNLIDLEPPLYDLNGKWNYKNINFPQGCPTTLKQTGDFIEFSEGCPTSSKSEGILSANQIEFCTDFIQHMRYCHTGQVLSPIKMEGKTYILWDYGDKNEGSEWSMNKAD